MPTEIDNKELEQETTKKKKPTEDENNSSSSSGGSTSSSSEENKDIDITDDGEKENETYLDKLKKFFNETVFGFIKNRVTNLLNSDKFDRLKQGQALSNAAKESFEGRGSESSIAEGIDKGSKSVASKEALESSLEAVASKATRGMQNDSVEVKITKTVGNVESSINVKVNLEPSQEVAKGIEKAKSSLELLKNATQEVDVARISGDINLSKVSEPNLKSPKAEPNQTLDKAELGKNSPDTIINRALGTNAENAGQSHENHHKHSHGHNQGQNANKAGPSESNKQPDSQQKPVQSNALAQVKNVQEASLTESSRGVTADKTPAKKEDAVSTNKGLSTSPSK